MQSTEKRSDIFLQSYAVAHPSVFSTVKCGERERERVRSATKCAQTPKLTFE
jgi:hypothetical protein